MGMIDAQEGRHVATCNIPNVFIQTQQDDTDRDGDWFIMKIRGQPVDMLLDIAHEVHRPCMVHEGKSKVLCIAVKKAICSMLTSALLFHKQWKNDLEGIGLKIKPCNACTANKTVNSKQLAVAWQWHGMLMTSRSAMSTRLWHGTLSHAPDNSAARLETSSPCLETSTSVLA